MAYSISQQLKSTFNLASLKQQATKDLNQKEWKKYRQITNKYNGIRRSEGRLYEMEYKTQVEVAKKRLINKAGSKVKKFKPPWAQNDLFDKAANNRQAHRNVQSKHRQLMGVIDRQEANEVQHLLKGCEKRIRLKEKPKREFNRAADRRQKPERRLSQIHKRSR